MRMGWIGFHREGLQPLRTALQHEAPICAVLTLEPALALKRSGAADYRQICAEFGVPLHFVRNINDDRSLAILRELALDVAFVIGWTQLVRRDAMSLARSGMIGAHASLLPSLRGRAPINWALIHGLSQTGNSLMWLAEGADRGDVIDQAAIPITAYDTCATLYGKVSESTTRMILRLLPRLLNGERPGQPQETVDGEPDLPARRPEDGVVDWSQPARRVYDFIRALTRPYPGALSWLGDRRYRLWEAALLPGDAAGWPPGRIIGPVISPCASACGVAVACNPGTVLLLDLEDDEGRILTGSMLSDQPWTGKRFQGQTYHA